MKDVLKYVSMERLEQFVLSPIMASIVGSRVMQLLFAVNLAIKS